MLIGTEGTISTLDTIPGPEATGSVEPIRHVLGVTKERSFCTFTAVEISATCDKNKKKSN